MPAQTRASEYVTGTAAYAKRQDQAHLRLVKPGDVYVDGKLIDVGPLPLRQDQHQDDTDSRVATRTRADARRTPAKARSFRPTAKQASRARYARQEDAARTNTPRPRQRYEWQVDVRPWQGVGPEERASIERQASRTLCISMVILFACSALAIIFAPLLF